MQILNAIEAISPAIARTKLLLYTPFRKGRTWKLSVTAYLSFAGTVFLPFTLMYGVIALAPQMPHALKLIVVGLSLVLTAIYVVVFVLCGRLKFAFFDMVLNRGEFVAPAWRKYALQSRRWTSVKLLLGTIFTALLAAPVFVVGRHMLAGLPSLSTLAYDPKQGPPQELVNLMIAFYGAYFIVMVIVGLYFLALATV